MKTRSACRCLLCQLESHLKEQLGEGGRQEDYTRLASSRFLLSAFPSIFALTTHLRTCRGATNGNHPADALLIELLHAPPSAGAGSLWRDVLLLAFIPTLHSTARQIASRYPALSPDDTAQHLVASLLEVLDSAELRDRDSHLAFAISRMLKRSVFGWAEHETRSTRRLEGEDGVQEPAAPSGVGEPFERVALLRHFLFRCQREGLLTGSDLELLVHIKLEGNFGEQHSASRYPNALRQRIKRLLGKLRQAARTPRSTRSHQAPRDTT